VKFQYIGFGDDPPTRTTVFGYEFHIGGAAVEVTDEHAIGKLSGNACFRRVEDVSGPDVTPEAVQEQDGNGDTDAALYRAALEDAGVRVDGRWGLARLKAEYEANCGDQG